MTTVQHTCATLLAVALAGEENYWLCEPATSRPLQSDWKSTPCRWLYPVDISLDRFAKMSGFDTTDSVFELGMEGVSRVEKYATLACDIKAKRQKEHSTVYFFVPHQEIARIDERYKLLLKKEQEELQRQLEQRQQQLEEKAQKQSTDTALQECENQKYSTQIKFSSQNSKSLLNDPEANLPQHEEMYTRRNAESSGDTLQKTANHEFKEEKYSSVNTQFEEQQMKEHKASANLSAIPTKQEIKGENDKSEQGRKSTTAKRRRKNLRSNSSQLTNRKNRETCNQRLEVGLVHEYGNPFSWKEYYVLQRKRGDAYLCKYAKGNKLGYRLTRIQHHPITLFILFDNWTHNCFNVNVKESCMPAQCSTVLRCNTSNDNSTAINNKSSNSVTQDKENNYSNSVLVLICNEEALFRKQTHYDLEEKIASNKNSELMYKQRSTHQKFEPERFEEYSQEDESQWYNEENQSSSESLEQWEHSESGEEWEREQQQLHESEEQYEEEHEWEEEEENSYNREDKQSRRKTGNERRVYRSDKNASRSNKRSKTEGFRVSDNRKTSNHHQRLTRQNFSGKSTSMSELEDYQKFTKEESVNQANLLREAALLETVGVNMWSDVVESVPTANEMSLQHPFTHDEIKDYNTAVFSDGTCVTYTPASYARVMAKREQLQEQQNSTSHTIDRTNSIDTDNEVGSILDDSKEFANTHNDTKEKVILAKESNVQPTYNQKHGATAQGCNDDDDMRVLLNNIELAKEQINFDLHK